MPEQIDLKSVMQGVISAPAGCGKTHLICRAILENVHEKPVLVLTHTNAGVAALRGRVQRLAKPSQFRLSTIDGWAMRLISVFPQRSGHDPDILALNYPRNDYPDIRAAAARLLESGSLDEVLKATYCRLIVDEYQDCNGAQHNIVRRLAQSIPTVVLGDPLQSIFGFNRNPVVDWTKDVLTSFALAGELSTPHRWINAGEEGFGRWLLEIRKDLIAGKGVDLKNLHGNAQWVALDGSELDRERKRKAGMTAAPTKDGKVLIIADSMNKPGQYDYAKQLPGAVVAEAVDLSDLVEFASGFNLSANDAIDRVVGFASQIMTNVGGDDMLRRLATLRAGKEKKPASNAEATAIAFIERPTYQAAGDVMNAIAESGGVKVHRPTMLSAFYATLRECSSGSGATPLEAASTTRERGRLIGRPLSKRTVGSTLLLKGLEADVSVILDVERMDASNLYVAMTRGARKLVVCSASNILPLR